MLLSPKKYKEGKRIWRVEEKKLVIFKQGGWVTLKEKPEGHKQWKYHLGKGILWRAKALRRESQSETEKGGFRSCWGLMTQLGIYWLLIQD